jgi:PAS domain S-box-containing protein
MIGSKLEPIIPERLRERHTKGFGEAVARGSTHYGDSDLLAVPATTAKGDTISIEFTVSLLRGQDEKVSYVAAVIRDVTARFNRERDMRRRLEALERDAGEGGEPATP